MAQRTLYLIRHGQRLDSINRNWYTTAPHKGDNKHDPPLSDHGHAQAAQLGQRLRDVAVDVMVSSPYLRALQTAHHIAAAREQRYYVENGLGEWLMRQLMSADPDITPPHERVRHFPYMDLKYVSRFDGEYPEDRPQVERRYEQAVRHLLATFSGDMMLVGHGKMVTATAAALTGLPEHQVRYNLAGLTTLIHDDDAQRWQLALNSDTAHLNNMPTIV